MKEQYAEIIMPLMGEGITEATLVRWLKKVGEWVEKDSPLLEVSTDKVDTEIPASASGFLIHISAEAGKVVPVNATLGFLGIAAETKVPEDILHATGSAKAQIEMPSKMSASNRNLSAKSDPEESFAVPGGAKKATPLVKKIARDMSIDINAVYGRGLNGRITKSDLFDFIDKLQISTALQLEPQWHEKTLTTQTIHGQEFLEGVAVRREKMSQSRKLIAKHMLHSVNTSAHASTVFEIDFQRVVDLRIKHKEEFAKQEGFNITYTHFVSYAAVCALKNHPLLNCSVDGDEILFKDDINLGTAVALGENLLVPVVKRAQELTFFDLCRKMNDLIVRARQKKLKPEEVQGGTFSITNPGVFGSLTSTPIINQPQVAILCLGTIVPRPCVVGQKIEIRNNMHLGITFDHRVVDGEGAAKYLAEVKNNLENFEYFSG